LELTGKIEKQLRQKFKTGDMGALHYQAKFIPNIHHRPLVLIVDQFEALFDQCQYLEERKFLIDNLLSGNLEYN